MSKDKLKKSASTSAAASSSALSPHGAGAGFSVADDERHLLTDPLFEYRSVSAFNATGYREEHVNAKRSGGKKAGKFKPAFMVLFQEYVLFYPLPPKADTHAKPPGLTRPADFLRLDTFNYHLIQSLTERVKEGGLVPKKEVFSHALVLGADESEMIVECSSQESLTQWTEALRARSKDLLRAVKELDGRNAKDVMVEIRKTVPEIPVWKKGPNEMTPESVAHWTKSMKDGWAIRHKYLTLAKGYSLYSQFADYRKYFAWYCTPSSVTLNSLEGDLLTTEDSVLGDWRRYFTDRSSANSKCKKLESLNASELKALLVTIESALQRIGWYNAFVLDVHEGTVQYDEDKKKWNALKAQVVAEETRRSDFAKKAEAARLQQQQEAVRMQQLAQQQQQAAMGTPTRTTTSGIVRAGSTTAGTPKSAKKTPKKGEDDPFGDVELKHI